MDMGAGFDPRRLERPPTPATYRNIQRVSELVSSVTPLKPAG